MADTQQTNPATPAAANPAPAVVDSPEPDIDSLLSQIPGLKSIFGDESGDAKAPKPKKEPVSEAAVPETIEEEISPGLDPAIPIIEELEPEPEAVEAEPEPEEVKDSVQKRIDKITLARRQAEEKAAALETELNQLKAKQLEPPPLPPTPENPLANVTTIEELNHRVQLSQVAKRWAIQHLDGGEIELDNGETKFLNGDQVKLLYSKAEDILTGHAPQRFNFLQEKQKWENTAKVAYPNLYKPGHQDQVEYKTWLTVFPEMQRYPDIAIIVGDAMLGRQLRMQREARQKNGAQANGNLPLSAPAPAAAPRVPRNRAFGGTDLSAIVTDPQSGALDQFVNQLIADAEQNRPLQRTKR